MQTQTQTRSAKHTSRKTRLNWHWGDNIKMIFLQLQRLKYRLVAIVVTLLAIILFSLKNSHAFTNI